MTLKIRYGENNLNEYVFEAPADNSEPPPYLREATFLVSKNKEPGLEFDSIPEDDDYIFDELVLGDAAGLYRLESYGAQCFTQVLQPRGISDLIYLLALDCPGPLLSGALAEYIDRKSKDFPVSFINPRLNPLLQCSHGAILYRKQVIEIAKAIAGYSGEEANELRLRLENCLPGGISDHRHRFIAGAERNRVDRPIAERLFKRIAYFSRYDFRDEWQAADHALIAYRSAYLKFHYPEEYLAALDNCNVAKGPAAWEEDAAVAELAPLVNRFMQARIAAEKFGDKANALRRKIYADLFGTS